MSLTNHCGLKQNVQSFKNKDTDTYLSKSCLQSLGDIKIKQLNTAPHAVPTLVCQGLLFYLKGV